MYMDNSATSPVDEEVLKEMLPFFNERFGNASTLYRLGVDAKEVLEKARKQVADLINADPSEITFTSGGTESDNMVIKGIALKEIQKSTEENPRNHIITSAIEHPAVLKTCEFLEKFGFEVTYLPVDEDGLISLDDLKNAIKDSTILITIMHANNEVGTIQPIKEIGEIAREHNIPFHTDAVQSAGKIPVDVKEQNIDLLSLSSHKINGPKGVGAVYIKKGIRLEVFMHGGGQENGLRSGTENIPGIVGFGKAAELANERLEEHMKHNQEIRDALIEKVLANIKDSYVNGSLEHRLPNNVHFRFSGVEGESLILRLDNEGIDGATGSACSTHDLKGSHVLAALGIKPALSHGSLRLSIGPENSIDDVDYIVASIKKVVDYLRDLSPLWDNEEDKYIGDRFEKPVEDEDLDRY
ncbi:MAG: cysteine desulfurase family protein [Methanosphaera sp.]|uniref:cysteine desulfurase family protein n=1 Tax=Methanosphaera TaxID=2316 RepID=UPI00237FF2D2|nr:cysteine desulfurase family protein [Candidatus Methanosphaera massiliense]MDD6285606.1 cysteine desulfurase family protein [Methanobacteriaceae archaeon]MDE4079064.1 cysteine desulfurase family protein [Candidatus Methanosphaera massiliense]MDY2744827.1 cysteine desulfurase family protein [Methanosphaera sp.]